MFFNEGVIHLDGSFPNSEALRFVSLSAGHNKNMITTTAHKGLAVAGITL